MPYLFLTVFGYFAERIATASITFEEQDQKTKHHYSNQRHLSSKSKPFTELEHKSRIEAVFQIRSLRCKSTIKPGVVGVVLALLLPLLMARQEDTKFNYARKSFDMNKSYGVTPGSLNLSLLLKITSVPFLLDRRSLISMTSI